MTELILNNKEEYDKFVEQIEKSGERFIWSAQEDYKPIGSRSPYNYLSSNIPITVYKADTGNTSGEVEDVKVLSWRVDDHYTIDTAQDFIGVI